MVISDSPILMGDAYTLYLAYVFRQCEDCCLVQCQALHPCNPRNLPPPSHPPDLSAGRLARQARAEARARESTAFQDLLATMEKAMEAGPSPPIDQDVMVDKTTRRSLRSRSREVPTAPVTRPEATVTTIAEGHDDTELEVRHSGPKLTACHSRLDVQPVLIYSSGIAWKRTHACGLSLFMQSTLKKGSRLFEVISTG